MALHRPRRSSTRRTRGLFIRSVGLFLGVALGGGVVVATQVPLAFAASQIQLNTALFASPTVAAAALVWPTMGSSAVGIPAVGVQFASPDQVAAPIASLTKLMTAYLVLRQLPLRIGQHGPCLIVSSADVAAYQFDQHSDQSSVLVAAGSQLCEIDLLNGLFVHSANNYSELLVALLGQNDANFVASMNAEAAVLGMNHTHYADVSGIDVHDVSTASDQLTLVELIMRSALVRSIVRQTSVVLPDAGVVRTYTPLLGTHGVVGVKSGRTDEAGGCDAMALVTQRGVAHFLTYAVVLGQRGPDLLRAVGTAAYALASSAARQVVGGQWSSGTVVGTVGWPTSRAKVVIESTRPDLWWQHVPPVSLRLYAPTDASCHGPSKRPQIGPGPFDVTVTWRATQLPSRWSAPLGTASCVATGSVVALVQFGTNSTFVSLVVATERTSRPAWWNGLR